MANYSISIKMSQKTVEDLQNSGFVMYAFKGVKTSAKGAPLVWFQTRSYALTTEVSWEEHYQAYTSTSAIVPNGVVVASNSYDIDLAQTLDVTGQSGTGSVSSSGKPGAIAINNETNVQFTCGISELVSGDASPICAFTLFGNNLDLIAPIERVLLMFSTTPVNTGSVIYQAYSPGLLIDLTGTNDRTVNYDINNGWSWDGGPWAQQVAAQSDLVPLLVVNSAELTKDAKSLVSSKHAR